MIHNYFDPIYPIKKYFEKYFVNTSNNTSILSLELNEKINNLREYISEYFWLNNHYISFINSLDDGLNILHQNLKIFDFPKVFYFIKHSTNHTSLYKQFKNLIHFHNVSEIKKKYKNFNKKTLWIFETVDKETIEYIFWNIKNSYIYLNIDNDIYIKKNFRAFLYADFLTFNPNNVFDIGGVIVFIYNQKHRLRPALRDSKFDENKNCPKQLECGTLNYPVLLLLKSYFWHLLYDGDDICWNYSILKNNNNLLDDKSETFFWNFNRIKFNINAR